jgi:2-methylisocitrate lyase-like PEP mutase family enzyme
MCMPTSTDFDSLAPLAAHLRALHRPGAPLVLVNVWDVASAREVAAAGAAALGTSSAAIAASLGLPDDNTSDPETVFSAIRRIAAGAAVPVTADLERGYGLDGAALVDGLLAAGAVGCNVEDSHHRQPGELIDADTQAEYLSGVREAARRRGVHIVLNARIDVLLHQPDADPASLLDQVLRRARLYLEAGADCVYPIRLVAPALVERLATELGAPVNANLGLTTTVRDMATAGASRISIGPMAHRQVLADLHRRAHDLLSR